MRQSGRWSSWSGLFRVEGLVGLGVAEGLTAIRVEGFVKRYGRRVAADGLTLDVKRGEILAIAGVAGNGQRLW